MVWEGLRAGVLGAQTRKFAPPCSPAISATVPAQHISVSTSFLGTRLVSKVTVPVLWFISTMRSTGMPRFWCWLVRHLVRGCFGMDLQEPQNFGHFTTGVLLAPSVGFVVGMSLKIF